MPTPQELADDALRFLRRTYPDAKYELDWTTPVELLVATILAAQCTDERVNRVTKTLFRRYRDARAYADADTAELELLVKPTGTYKAKAKSIRGACRELVARFGGQVPRTLDELTTLPGVARKTANVVLNTAFDLPSGVIVDTHVARVSRRLGLTAQAKPEAIERDLMDLVRKDEWTFFGPAMVLHGRYTCTAIDPKCPMCGLNGVCEKNGVGAGVAADVGDADEFEAEEDSADEATESPPASADAYDASDGQPAATKSPRGRPRFGGGSPAAGAGHGSYDQPTPASEAQGYDGYENDDRPAKTAGRRQKPARPSPPAPASPAYTPSGGGDSIYDLPGGWKDVLSEELSKPYFRQLAEFVAREREQHEVFPPPEDVYTALAHTPYEDVSVLLLGQDPYHDVGQAHGLCFSVRPGVRPPPSLVNMFKELRDDVGVSTPRTGDLTPWADQGVLLLNAVLTVRAHQPNSHKDRGWEKFTDAVIRKVSEKAEPVVFVLWGGYAQKKERLIDAGRHTVIKGAHPSPLSASNGFFGSRPFSRVNEALRAAGKRKVDWGL